MPYSAVWCISQVRISHLEGDALLADDGGVQRLIEIGLWGGNIILKPVGDGAEHIVNNAEDVVAVVDRVHNDRTA